MTPLLSNAFDMEVHGRIRAHFLGRPVLVCGADGFLGFNTVLRLVELGARVSIISRRAVPRLGDTSRLHAMFHGDLRDGSLVRGAVKGQDVVLDLAGASGAAHSNRDPFRHLEDECGPHLGLFQACADSDPPPFLLFCSSRLVYGKPIQLPVDETHPLHPLSIYGVHKISLELYLKVFRAIRGLPFSVLRLSNAYGPNQPEETTHYGILNLFIQRAARGLPIQVYGDGRQKRDYVYVDDVITACLLLAMNPVCCGDTFNFGGREGIGVGDAARLVAALAGGTPVDSVPWPADTKSIETGDYQTDLARIDRLVGLPTQTRLRDGILATLEYYRGRD